MKKWTWIPQREKPIVFSIKNGQESKGIFMRSPTSFPQLKLSFLITSALFAVGKISSGIAFVMAPAAIRELPQANSSKLSALTRQMIADLFLPRELNALMQVARYEHWQLNRLRNNASLRPAQQISR